MLLKYFIKIIAFVIVSRQVEVEDAVVGHDVIMVLGVSRANPTLSYAATSPRYSSPYRIDINAPPHHIPHTSRKVNYSFGNQTSLPRWLFPEFLLSSGRGRR
jgi:hypothetical protein